MATLSPRVPTMNERQKQLLVEALIIGGSTAMVGEVLSVMGMKTGRPGFWFAVGIGTHLAWEASGGNRWFLENRDSQSMPKGLLT